MSRRRLDRRDAGRREGVASASATSAPATFGGSPSSIGLTLIVLFFSFKADNFFTAPTSPTWSRRWRVTMLAYGVVFVLLIGEIDLSIS